MSESNLGKHFYKDNTVNHDVDVDIIGEGLKRGVIAEVNNGKRVFFTSDGRRVEEKDLNDWGPHRNIQPPK